MAFYPETDNDIRVDPVALTAVCGDIFRAAGMSAEDAQLLAETLVASDRRGVHSHGVLRTPDYVKKVTQDGVDPRGVPTVKSKVGGAIVVDGGNSMGQIGGTFAMDQAIEAARENGVAFAALENSNHCGAMDWYAMRASAVGMIGLCGTNALPTMAPVGGREKIVGINPVGLAIPGGDEGDFVLDFAFGATAHGKIRVYHQKGLAIPPGWALNAQGEPTTDAAEALVGLIQPIGGHKGVALGMAVGMLATLLTGAGYGLESGSMEEGAKPGRDGQFFIAINVATFTDLQSLRQRVDGIVQQVHASARASGIERLYVPGEIETLQSKRYSQDGILLPADTVRDILTVCKTLQIDPPEALVQAGFATSHEGAS